MPKNDSTKKGSSNKDKEKSASSSKVKAPFGKDLYSNLVDSLSIIFLHEKTIEFLKKDQIFSKTVAYYLNAIYTYELSVKQKEPKANDFKTAFITITGNKEHKLSKLSKKEIDDLEDNFNFLSVYIKNTFGESWTDIVASFSKSGSVSSISLVEKQQESSTNQQNTTTNNSQNFNNSSQNFNAEEFMRRNNMSMNQIADTVILQQANLLLLRDIKDNKFYQYNSKPSFFVWAKWALFVLWILCAIFLIVSNFIVFALPNSSGLNALILNQGAVDKIIENSYKIDYNIIKDSIITIQGTPPFALFSIIISLFPPVFIIWFAINQIKNNKNENAKFTCKTFVTWILLIFLIFNFLPGSSGSLFDRQFDFNFLENTKSIVVSFSSFEATNGNVTYTFSTNQQLIANIMIAKSALSISYIISVVLSTIASVAIIIVRPKLDLNRIKLKINEYVEDIKAGRISLDNDGQGFGTGMFGGRNPFSPF